MNLLTPVAGLSGTSSTRSLPIKLVSASKFSHYKKSLPAHVLQWLKLHRFEAESGQSIMIANVKGELDHVVLGMCALPDAFALASLPAKLPEGVYHLDGTFYSGPTLDDELLSRFAYGWALACYRFGAFKKQENHLPVLQIPSKKAYQHAVEFAEAAYFARDLINLPANHLGATELLDFAQQIAKTYGARSTRIQGDALLKKNYPAVHAVGRAAANPPGIIDFQWGEASHPKVTLVGKGVCFDTGGLDIKGSQNMRLMKKDMGGAAVVLALAKLVMAMQLPVRLRVLIPAVENSISANAFRPGDVIATRKGLTVEIGNTDAEGRLILCDALAEADNESPDLLIDCATLTGAARVALGTDIPAYFTPSQALSEKLERACHKEQEALWRLPLHKGYSEMLESKIADINNAPDSAYGGAIAAALFLQRFVEKTTEWMHIDMMAWNVRARPGHPIGGEAHALRSLFQLVQSLSEEKHAGAKARSTRTVKKS